MTSPETINLTRCAFKLGGKKVLFPGVLYKFRQQKCAF